MGFCQHSLDETSIFRTLLTMWDPAYPYFPLKSSFSCGVVCWAKARGLILGIRGISSPLLVSRVSRVNFGPSFGVMRNV